MTGTYLSPNRLMILGLLMFLGALASAQPSGGAARPLQLPGRTASASFAPGSTIAYGPARDVVEALDLTLLEARAYATIQQGARVIVLDVEPSLAQAAARTAGMSVGGSGRRAPAAARVGGMLYVPLRAVAEAVGASFSDDGRRVLIGLEPARITRVPSATFPGYDRVVLELTRDARFTHRLDGSEVLLRLRNATATDAIYDVVGGTHVGQVRVRPIDGAVEVRVPLKGAAGYTVYPLAATGSRPARIVIDVGPRFRQDPPALLARPLTVALDAGHGGSDLGARAGALTEKDVTLSVALAVGSALKARGARIVYTRSNDANPAIGARQAAGLGADVLVSLHAATAAGSSAAGITAYYLSDDAALPAVVAGARAVLSAREQVPLRAWIARFAAPAAAGAALADAVVTSAGERLAGTRARALTDVPLAVLRDAPGAATLVELGWLSDSDDRARLGSADGRRRTAQAIASGIIAFLGPRLREGTAR